jgi:hypothetical protein
MDCCGGARTAVTEAFPQAVVITDTVHMRRAVRDKKALLVGDDRMQALAQVQQLVHWLMEATSESQFLALAAVVRQEVENGMRQGGAFVIFFIFWGKHYEAPPRSVKI